eukprot:m.9496 g.9496  ORF g.9496 m.9496 type:complete len:137 (+) comp4073_c0_seq2:516-926(+)
MSPKQVRHFKAECKNFETQSQIQIREIIRLCKYWINAKWKNIPGVKKPRSCLIESVAITVAKEKAWGKDEKGTLFVKIFEELSKEKQILPKRDYATQRRLADNLENSPSTFQVFKKAYENPEELIWPKLESILSSN